MKYCNNSGYCGYRFQEGSLMGCQYEGYCDYQCPKDSRMQPLLPYPKPFEQCTCGTTNTDCPVHGKKYYL